MSFWRTFYHLVWSTKYRSPLLTATIEPFAHDVLRSKAIQLQAIVYALNGTENHVHMVVSVPPSLGIAEFVNQVKGVTSYRINREQISPLHFGWQIEYGVFTFDEKRLPCYVRYVERQKEHHAQNRVIPILERTEEVPPPPTLRETTIAYTVNDTAWWADMMAMD